VIEKCGAKFRIAEHEHVTDFAKGDLLNAVDCAVRAATKCRDFLVRIRNAGMSEAMKDCKSEIDPPALVDATGPDRPIP
jgi:hypothetical protein